jgi:methionyl-tRNA formyltransferase
MRLVFLGNGPFARPALDALFQSTHSIELVVARPDLPSGKHQRVEPGPVASLAAELGLPLIQPPDANAADCVEQIRRIGPDLLVVVDFGQLLSSELLGAARFGGINIHGSLLPKYRGSAPIVWAVYHGDKESGVSIIQMTPRLDAGGVILQESVPIGPNQTAGELEEVLAPLGARLALQAVGRIASGAALPIPQDPSLATKAPRLKKDHGRIEWTRTAQQIHDQVRALNPWPIAFTEWRRDGHAPLRLQILESRPEPQAETDSAPGTVAAVHKDRFEVATGAGRLTVLRLKPAGKPAMDAGAFLRGAALAVGQHFA